MSYGLLTPGMLPGFGEAPVMTPQAFIKFSKAVRRTSAERLFVIANEVGMEQAIEPREVSFDAYTMCSFLPNLDSSRAIPLLLIGYHHGDEPWFVWLVPKEGISPHGLTEDPYYAKVLRDPHTYFVKKLNKYIEETGSVKRGIEMLIDCHQNHLAFTPLVSLQETPFTHPMTVELLAAV